MHPLISILLLLLGFLPMAGAPQTDRRLGVVESDWPGWSGLNFDVSGQPAILILQKAMAPGDPWIWRAERLGDRPAPRVSLELFAQEIELRPRFLQTIWFYLLCAGLTASVFLGAYLRGVRLLRRKEQALQETRIRLETEVRNRMADLQRDHTERQHAEAKLAEASGLLEAMLENSADFIYFKDRTSRFVRFSKSFLAHVGPLTDPEKLRGMTDAEIFASDHAQSALTDEQEIIRTGRPIISKLEKETYPDGHVSWALTTKMPWRDGTGAIIGTFGISRDVTDLKETEGKLAYERDQLRALLDSSPDTIYFKNAQSRFVLVSRSKVQKAIEHVPDLRARRTARGLPADVPEPELLTGLTDFDTYHDQDAHLAYADEQQIVRTGKAVIGKLEKHIFLDGAVCWTLTSKMPWRDGTGVIIGTFGISKDITDLKVTEEKVEQLHRQLLATSRQAGMAEIATSVLHNVGNVLNSVNVSATLIAEQVRNTKGANLAKLAALFEQHKEDLVGFLIKDSRGQMIPRYLGTLSESLADEQKSLLTEIERLCKNIEHINDIVAEQQAYARTLGVIETISVSDMIEDALRINASSLARHDVDTVRDYQARPVITTDKHKVVQILVNLVRNAECACDDSGRADQQITVRTTSDERGVKIAIVDNGVGIPSDNLTRIFAPGFTTSKTGYGFDLHSSALAAKELGGALSAQSDGPGHGATFILELPHKSDTSVQEISAH